YEDTGHTDLAEQTHRKAADAMAKLAHDYPSAAFLQNFVADRRILSMVYSARRGRDIPRLISEADALTKQKDLSALSCYNLACLYAVVAAAEHVDGAKTALYAQNAMDLLIRCEKMNFFRRGTANTLVKSDSDLNALRQREDFKALLNRVDGGPGK